MDNRLHPSQVPEPTKFPSLTENAGALQEVCGPQIGALLNRHTELLLQLTADVGEVARKQEMICGVFQRLQSAFWDGGVRAAAEAPAASGERAADTSVQWEGGRTPEAMTESGGSRNVPEDSGVAVRAAGEEPGQLVDSETCVAERVGTPPVEKQQPPPPASPAASPPPRPASPAPVISPPVQRLELTVGGAAALSAEAIHAKLLQMLQGATATTDEVAKWISVNVGDRAKTPEFIRVLTTAVCETAYQASSSKKFDEALFSRYSTLLQKYIDTNEELELHCLYAVQELNHRLEQPSGLLCSLFQSLWDYGCVANETFLKWEQSKDPAFLEGKGIALKSLKAFFTALREADDDSSEDYS